MADTNTYTSKQNIKKYTTQAKFDAIDKSDVPVGTEYNIVGSIAESDLDSDLQAKINSTTPIVLYKHQLTFTSGHKIMGTENGYACIYSSKNTPIASLADLKTILGNTFQLPVSGQYLYLDGGDNYHYFDYCYVTESKIYVRSYLTSGGTPDEVERIITDVENVSWSHITITDIVTAI